MSDRSDRLLEVKGLSIAVGPASDPNPMLLVDTVSFDVAQGQVLGLIGESGAGKSTIGLAALGYVRPGCRLAGGTIRLDGKTMFDDRMMRGGPVTYVPQSAAASFNPAFRLVRQVIETAVVRGILDRRDARRTACELFKGLGLRAADFGARFPHQVSGGQLQRAAIAMALCTRPQLVVFDEPTTALDVTVQVEVLMLIRDAIRNAGLSGIYISHDLAVVAQVADDIMVLRHGKTVEHASTRVILEAPQQDYTQRLLSVRMATRLATGEASLAPVLEGRSITAGYGTLDVNQDVSFSLKARSTLAVVGESGSGKSSLARVITGLLAPRQGSSNYNAEPLPPRLTDRPLETRRHIQLIYQNPDVALNPRQTVGRILSRPLQLYFGLKGAALRVRVDQLLDQIELPGSFKARLPGELSGGQKQRLCIARALAAEPGVVICDEVTSALDPLVADGIVRLLMRLQRETHVAYIVITHDIALVRAVADDVLVMKEGRCVEYGPAAGLLASPADPYTRALIDAVPKLQMGWLDGVTAARTAVRV